MVKLNIIGEQLKEIRRTAVPHLSQADLAARLHLLGISINQSGISKIENGQCEVTDVEVAALAKVLKVPVASLFGDYLLPDSNV